MKLVRQKNDHDCGLASIFMLKDNKDYRRIKKFCKKHLYYNPNKGHGIFINNEKICDQLKLIGIESYFAQGAVKTIAHHTRYNRAMLLLYGDDKEGHCVAWKGYCCYDPATGEAYPEKLIKAKNPRLPNFSIIVFKTPLHERALNFIKKPFYDLIQ